jgi:hypothetical protein
MQANQQHSMLYLWVLEVVESLASLVGLPRACLGAALFLGLQCALLTLWVTGAASLNKQRAMLSSQYMCQLLAIVGECLSCFWCIV